MKHKLAIALITVLMALFCILALAACNAESHIHSMIYHSETAATCTDSGNIEYWSCSSCGKCFSDNEGLNEISSIIIPAKGHTYSSEWSHDGTYHWHKANCDHIEEISGKAEHSFGEWTDDKNEDTHSCTCICGMGKTEKHSFGEWKDNNDGTHMAICMCGATMASGLLWTWKPPGRGTASGTPGCSSCIRREKAPCPGGSISVWHTGDPTTRTTLWCPACFLKPLPGDTVPRDRCWNFCWRISTFPATTPTT